MFFSPVFALCDFFLFSVLAFTLTYVFCCCRYGKKVFKIKHTLDYVAKFFGDRPRKLRVLALKKENISSKT